MGEEELKIIEGPRFVDDRISSVNAYNNEIIRHIDAIHSLSDATELPEELERILDCIASTGSASGLSWGQLKLVLHKKIDIVSTVICVSPPLDVYDLLTFVIDAGSSLLLPAIRFHRSNYRNI